MRLPFLLLALIPALAAPAAAQQDPGELSVWNDPAFRRRLAESYLSESEIEPRVTEDERDAILAVLEKIGADQLDEAAAMLEAQGLEMSSAVFDFTLANIRFQQDRLEEALSSYRAAVEKFPRFRRAWKNIGMIHVRRGEFAEAAPALTRVLETGGVDGMLYGLLGYCHSNLGRPLAAETAYRMAILLDPETADWRMGLARSLFKQQRYPEAAALVGAMAEAAPDRADLWLLQANAYLGMNQPMRAAENYELVDRLGGSTAASLNGLADIYVNQELFDLAVDAYLRALGLSDTPDLGRPMRAAQILVANGALAEMGRLVDGIEEITGEAMDDADRKALLKLRARLAVAQGAGAEEAAILEEIVRLDPLDGEALLLLGQYHHRNGDAEQAIFLFERAAQLEGHEADARVRHAQVLVSTGRYAEALPLLRRAQAIAPRENVRQYLESVERVAQSRS
jgi:tetratricopeptide (TPR) repeat protein